jgi:hypothetical protein
VAAHRLLRPPGTVHALAGDPPLRRHPPGFQ